MSYQEIEGNLITLALQGQFDVITHGCNCFCTMGAGIAVSMKETFGCNDPDLYKLEAPKHIGNFNKLGCIEDRLISVPIGANLQEGFFDLIVINSYTQYFFGRKGYQQGFYNIPLDYDALTLCMRKINHKYGGKKIGLPRIGCNLAGGDWNKVSGIIKQNLRNMEVTIVNFKQ